MSLEGALEVLVGVTPVPGLELAYKVFKFIVTSVLEVHESKAQLHVLAQAIGQLLATLNSEFRASKLVEASCAKPLKDLKTLLDDVLRFIQKEQDRSFFKSLLYKDARIAGIEGFYRRISVTVDAFQISALLNVQKMLREDGGARKRDKDALEARLKRLECSQVELRRTLDINQQNILAMMISIERRLGGQRLNSPEDSFYSHTLQYLTSTSGQQIKVEDWMVSSFEVDIGLEIGTGGFGKVYKGTWNRTEVAIKVIQNIVGVIPSSDVLRKEIEIWSTLRHPNILQFLGANTFDDRPFVVMPYMPNNAREFLRKRPDFDQLYILRDMSLGLEYLHFRKICHGDLKGINVLVDESNRALLCDFGLARVRADVNSRTSRVGDTTILGSRNWMAPEVLTGSLPKMPSDIYAFGMTIYELYTDENPLSNVAYGDFLELVFRCGMRPDRPDDDECPKLNDALWELAEQCWVQDPKARPTAPEIHDKIIHMIADAPHSSSANTFEQETPRIFQFPSPENETSRSSEAVAPPPFPVPVVFHPRSSKPSARDPSPMPPTPQRKSHRIRFIPLSDSVPFKPVVCELREGGAPIVITRTSRFETPLGTLTFTSRVISRRHAELSVRSGPRFFIRDTKSASGTFVNSLRLSEANTTSICHQLNDGDNLQLGVRYGLDAVPLDPLHIPVRMMVQIGPQLGGETVDVFSPAHDVSPPTFVVELPPDTATLLRLTQVPTSAAFDELLCQLVEGAPPLSISRWSSVNKAPAVMMRSKAVSREHAVLWREQGKILIKDTMSRGGTFINGLRLSAENQESIPHVVRDGDMLTFGTSWRSEISEQRSVKVKVQLEGIPASAVPDVSKIRPAEAASCSHSVLTGSVLHASRPRRTNVYATDTINHSSLTPII